MQLLGINLYEETPMAVRKALEPGWYPFGNYKKPAKSKPVIIAENYFKSVAYRIYQRDALPQISVNCIIGMNGAGKSTLLDIFYRMINNMAVRLLGPLASMQRGRKLTYARGVYADLYFICEDIQYRISCRDNRTSLYEKNSQAKVFHNIYIRGNKDAKRILTNMFYTISTNYSLYAFNQNEYIVDEGETEVNTEGINGDWLSGLFHKNDGYFTPLVITPFREYGNIDVEKENRLASQRIMALALLQQSQGVSFIDRYEARTLHYELDKGYNLRTIKNYQQQISAQYQGLDISHIIRLFEEIWENYFQSKYDKNIPIDCHDRYEQALFYMAYKTVKICFTYEDYSKAMGVEILVNHCDTLDRFADYCNRIFPKKAKKVFQKLVKEMTDLGGERNHITLKLAVCKVYIESLMNNNPKWDEKGHVSVNDLIEGKIIHSFNDAVLLLPPAFYRCNMTFCVKSGVASGVPDSSWGITKTNEFSLGKMSSGERQILYSLSYVLYHIKNIQSIREDENRVAYHNICLIFDEAELYFHPDYQRKFLGMLLESLTWCNINTEKIHSIQIIVVTHSPFVLTDMLVQNSLYLKGGKRINVNRETFGANYYEMLNKSFFFDKRAIGEISAQVIGEWIRAKNNHERISEEQLSLVGDELLKNYLKNYVQD